MSIDNKNKAVKGKIYSLKERPPVHNCGGKLDEEGNDTYWGKSLTLQADEEHANINKILQKYAKTGQLNANVKYNPIYADYSDVPSFHESLNIVLKANEQFMGLDAEVRSRFANDPSKFLEFVNDSKNLDEMVKLGLASKKPIKEKVQAPASTPASDPAKSV